MPCDPERTIQRAVTCCHDKPKVPVSLRLLFFLSVFGGTVLQFLSIVGNINSKAVVETSSWFFPSSPTHEREMLHREVVHPKPHIFNRDRFINADA